RSRALDPRAGNDRHQRGRGRDRRVFGRLGPELDFGHWGEMKGGRAGSTLEGNPPPSCGDQPCPPSLPPSYTCSLPLPRPSRVPPSSMPSSSSLALCWPPVVGP